ncbi:hypothetical protein C2E23DRAFT_136763 [Lenzites betulinus]|nr:hypothetical protein C2E23DRAFT_136763 [Lenzites betulinus]
MASFTGALLTLGSLIFILVRTNPCFVRALGAWSFSEKLSEGKACALSSALRRSFSSRAPTPRYVEVRTPSARKGGPRPIYAKFVR